MFISTGFSSMFSRSIHLNIPSVEVCERNKTGPVYCRFSPSLTRAGFELAIPVLGQSDDFAVK